MSENTWMHRIVRLGVRPLVGTRVTPNQLTTARLATGVGAAAALTVGTPHWLAGGAGLLCVSMFLDRADGELARLRAQTSVWGHKYDLICDAMSNALVFLGLGIGLRGGPLGGWAPAMGLVASLAVAAILLFMLRAEEVEGQRAAHPGSVGGWDADDAMIFVPLLIWAGWAEAVVVAAAGGTPMFGFYLALRQRRRRVRV